MEQHLTLKYQIRNCCITRSIPFANVIFAQHSTILCLSVQSTARRARLKYLRFEMTQRRFDLASSDKLRNRSRTQFMFGGKHGAKPTQKIRNTRSTSNRNGVKIQQTHLLAAYLRTSQQRAAAARKLHVPRIRDVIHFSTEQEISYCHSHAKIFNQLIKSYDESRFPRI